jgi:hypothetical protein
MKTTKTLNTEEIIRLMHGQAKSADMWIEQWERYKDVGGIRNAALAIGKLAGHYQILCVMKGADENVPEDIIALMQKYYDIWDNLHISKVSAGALASS